MLTLTYTAPHELEWREAREPSLSSDRAALVRPIAVATCDLDALIIGGHSPFAPPFPIGHECVAEVTDLGDAVTSLAPGQLVSVPFQISCGECPECRRGRSGNCTGVAFMSTYGFGPAVGEWGGFLSDRVCVPYAEHMLVPLSEGLSPAALASASDKVVGGASSGSIGLYAVALARALGAQSVVYVDGDEGRRRTAQGLGADALAEPPKRLGPFPVTVDSSADPDGLRLALRSTAPEGTCTSTAIYFGEQPSLPLLEMYTKGITFKTGRVHAREAIPHVLELAAARAIEPELITTRVIQWSDAAEALSECDWTKLVIERSA